MLQSNVRYICAHRLCANFIKQFTNVGSSRQCMQHVKRNDIFCHQFILCNYLPVYIKWSSVDTEFSTFLVVCCYWIINFAECARPASPEFQCLPCQSISTLIISSVDLFDADMEISVIVLLSVCLTVVSATHQQLKSDNVKVYSNIAAHLYLFRVHFLFEISQMSTMMMSYPVDVEEIRNNWKTI